MTQRTVGHRRAVVAAVGVLGMVLALLVAAPPPAGAQETFEVTMLEDRADPEECEDTGDCSLREAVILANDTGTADTIVLTLSGTYTLTIAGGIEQGDPFRGDLDVFASVTIVGPGSGAATIDASGLHQEGLPAVEQDEDPEPGDRIFNVHGPITFTLEGVTLQGGRVQSGSSSADGAFYECEFGSEDFRFCDGGAILVDADFRFGPPNGVFQQEEDTATLVTDDVVIRGNVASSGGGIAAVGFDTDIVLQLSNTVVTGNVATGQGEGGNDVLFGADATAEVEVAEGQGGGIYVQTSNVEATLSGVTVGSDQPVTDPLAPPAGANVAGSGGGITIHTSTIDATISGSAISGNAAQHDPMHADAAGLRLAAFTFDDVDTEAAQEEGPLTVRLVDSDVSGNAAAHGPGGMYLEGVDAEIVRTTVTGNTGRGEFGGDGGIQTFGTNLWVERSEISDNAGLSEFGNGGLIVFGGFFGREAGDLTMIDSTVHGNRGGDTGGVAVVDFGDFLTEAAADPRFARFADRAQAQEYSDYVGYTVDISGTIFSDNEAHVEDGEFFGARAGALRIERYSGTITNSTFSGNAATFEGAGIRVRFFGEEDLNLVNVTFEGNENLEEPDFGPFVEEEFRHGNAIHVDEPFNNGESASEGEALAEHPPSVTLLNTLLAGSSDVNCGGDTDRILSFGHNLDDDGSCVGDPPAEDGDLAGVDPQLGPLADNGGPTLTHALPQGSPAIDAGTNDGCPATDQRGIDRPQDGDLDGSAVCDIGAYEFAPTPRADLAVTKTDAPDPVRVGQNITYTVTVTNNGPQPATGVTLADTLDPTVGFISATPSPGSCSHTGQLLGGTVTCSLGGLAVGGSATVTIVVRTGQSGTVTNTATVASDLEDPNPANNVAQTTTTVEAATVRLAGRDRIETAIAVSGDTFGPGEAGAVVLARSDEFPDALAGTPLAIRANAPLLLNRPDVFDARVEAELQRVLPVGGTVYMLGGTAALSSAVQARVEALGYTVIRLGGLTRFDTAIVIAQQGLNNPPVLLVATGLDFPDALSAGAAGGIANGAVVLTSGDRMPGSTGAYIASRPGAQRFAIGGPASRADPAARALVGATRFETALTVADQFVPTPRTVGIATAMEFADALSGGAHIGRLGGPVLLTTPDSLHSAVRAYLERHRATIDSAFFYGGRAAISDAVEQAVLAAIS